MPPIIGVGIVDPVCGGGTTLLVVDRKIGASSEVKLMKPMDLLEFVLRAWGFVRRAALGSSSKAIHHRTDGH